MEEQHCTSKLQTFCHFQHSACRNVRSFTSLVPFYLGSFDKQKLDTEIFKILNTDYTVRK